MKNFKIILLLIIAFIIGLHFESIASYLKADIKKAMHVQYCNDIYMGRSHMLDACLLDINHVKY